jgi:hypothetical protein
MKRLLLIYLLIAIYTITNAQSTQNIKGKIIDSETKNPLIGAQIILIESSPIKGCVSNKNGDFILEKISTGRVSIKISLLGYQERIMPNLDLHPGKELVLEIALTEKIYTTKEVEIIAEVNKDRPKNEIATVSARTFSIEETKRYAGAMGDPSRMAQNYAGVMSAGDARNDIIIRGNSPMGLLWRLEGMDIPNPNHFGASGTTGGPVTILNNNLLSNSDFFTGAFPAEFGNALSGAFDLEIRNGNKDKYEFIGQIGFNGFELAAEGPFSKNYDGSFILSYRYSTLAVMDNIGLSALTGSSVPQYQDLTFKINLPTKKLGRFYIFGIGGTSFIKIWDSEKEDGEFSYGLTGTDTDFGSDMGVLGISHIFFPTSKTRIKTNFNATGTQGFTLIDSLSQQNLIKTPFLRSSNSEKKLSFSTNLTHKFNTKNILKAGVQIDQFKVIFKDSIFLKDENAYNVMSDYSGELFLTQGYVQLKHRFTEALFATVGIHAQHFGLNHENSIEPRAGIEYRISQNQRISAGYGKHSQIQPKILYFVETKLNNGEYDKTNLDLESTKSDHYVLAYDWNIKKNLRIKVESYLQKLSNIPVTSKIPDYSVINEGAYFTISLVDNLVNKGTSQNMGIELTIEKFMNDNFYFLTTASIFKSEYKGFNENKHSTAFDNNYVINVLGGYEWNLSEKTLITFDLRAVLAGGKPYIPIDEIKSAQENTTVYDWENAYSLKVEDYLRFDLKLGLRLNGKKISQEWAFDIQNVTNHQNVFQQYWDTQNNKLATDYQQGFFPMVFYRIYF